MIPVYREHLYLISYYARQIRAFSGAGGVDYVTQISQDNVVTKFVERNGISKTFVEMKKIEQENLKQLLNNFKYNRGSIAKQIVGDDYISKFDTTDPEA